MNIAIIPARGGSKRIPKKNIKLFRGVPIISYPIRTALKSGLFDRVFVSTEDPEIADSAIRFGAEIISRTEPCLWDDVCPSTEVVRDAVDQLSSSEADIITACCIYPTAALINEHDLRNAASMLSDEDTAYVISVSQYEHPIQRAFSLTSSSVITGFNSSMQHARTQDQEPYFHDAGQFYFGRRQAWLERCPIFSDSTRAVILPRSRAIDIDSMDDWTVAEAIYDNKLRASVKD